MISESSTNRILDKIKTNTTAKGTPIQQEAVAELIPLLEEYVWKDALKRIERNHKKVSIPLFGSFRHKLSIGFREWFRDECEKNPLLYFITFQQKKKIRGEYCKCVEKGKRININIEALLKDELKEIRKYVKSFDSRIILKDKQ
jgi:hypothetical protein